MKMARLLKFSLKMLSWMDSVSISVFLQRYRPQEQSPDQLLESLNVTSIHGLFNVSIG